MSLEPAEHVAVPAADRSDAVQAWIKTAKPLLVTGGPFCGTSILAKGLQRSGWFAGDRLAPLSERDAAGGGHDEDIVLFNRRVLASRQVELMRVESLQRAASVDFDAGFAQQLLYRKFHDKTAWGWKDYQASLLLEQWDRVLPAARWLIAVRPPATFVWSLMCRNMVARVSPYPLGRARAALRLWTAYHGRIVQFAHERPNRCCLLMVPDDISYCEQLSEIVRAQWGCALDPVDLSAIYVPSLLKKEAPGWVTALTRSSFPAQRVYRQLQAFAGRPGTSVRKTGTASPVPVRPKVCISTSYPFRVSETFVLAHATRLPADVRVLTSVPSLTTEDGLPLQSRWDRIVANVVGEFRNPNVGERTARSLARYFRRQKFDAVMAEFGPNGCVVMEACRRCRIPLIVHFHGYDVFDTSPPKRAIHARYPKLFEIASALIGVSRQMIERLAEMGAPREKLFYNPCGVDTSMFAGADPANNPPTFLAVGRFVDKKAPHLSVLAFKQLLERVPEARLLMIGGGDLFEPVRHMVKALGISDSVEMSQARSHYDVAVAMRKARAFIQHSVIGADGNSEGTPVSVLEAGSSGLPVVATRHAGIPDVVMHGKTGFLVEEFDIGAMAEAMQTLAENPALAGTLGGAAREHVAANFSMDRSIARLWSVIEGTLSPKT